MNRKVVIVNVKKGTYVVKGGSNQEIASLISSHFNVAFSAYMVKQITDVLGDEPEYTKGVESGIWENGKKLN